MGSLWMLVAGLLFGCMGVFVKLGAAYFSHIELVFYRSFFGLLLIYLIMRQQRVSVATQYWRNHLWRGISGSVALALFFYLSLIHISEPTRLGMISYAVFCLKKKKKTI